MYPPGSIENEPPGYFESTSQLFTEDQLLTIKVAVDSHLTVLLEHLRGLLPGEDDEFEREVLTKEVGGCNVVLDIIEKAVNA